MSNIPNQHLSQHAGHLLINPLLCARQLDVHVTIDAHETAFVFGLAPFETDNDLFVDSIQVLDFVIVKRDKQDCNVIF